MTRPESTLLVSLAGLALALAAGCSDTPDGTNGAGTSSGGTSGGGSSGGSSGGGCTSAFCLEEQRQIGVDPHKLVFPDIDPSADPYELTLQITHAGSTGKLQINQLGFDPATDEFSTPGFEPGVLDPGAVMKVKVVYKPAKSGAKTLALLIANNDIDPADRSYRVPVVVHAGAGALKVSPDPINFGPVASGKCADKEAKLYNTGTKPLGFNSIELSASGSPDFEIVQKPELKTRIEPGKSTTVTLRFCPHPGEDNDTTDLVIETDDGKLTVTQVFGGEIISKVTVVPPKLDYGCMKLGDSAKRSFKIFSEGLATLEIPKIELAALPPPQLSQIQIDQTGPLSLEPGKSAAIQVEIKADKAVKVGSITAALIVHTNDPVRPKITIPLFVCTESGKLQVTPPDAVDFAIAAKGVAVDRTLMLSNVGSAELKVAKVELVDDAGGEFSMDPGGYGPAQTPATEQLLQVGKPQALKLTFKPATTSGKAKGKLVITSDDPGKPSWPVNLFGQRAQGATCAIQVIPAVANMGLISFGKSTTSQIRLRNVGTGYCSFSKVLIRPCPASGFGPLQGPPTCTQIGDTQFKSFAPSTKLFHLGPGEIGKMQVQFNAPNDAGFFADPKAIQSYQAFIAFEFADEVTGQKNGQKKWYPKSPNDIANLPKYKPNLLAKVGRSGVSVLPDNIDFGLVTVGCKSKVQGIRVYNTGNIPVFVTKVELQGCGVEVEKYKWPGIPKKGIEVNNAQPASFGLQYAPQDVGKDSCQAVVTTGVEGKCVDAAGVATGQDCKVTAECTNGNALLCRGQVFTVPLKGEGTLLDEYTDEFDLSAGKKVDVLFVIDNSGSMGDEQKNIANNFNSFVQLAELWQNDYHVGVTSTDMKGGLRGKLRDQNGVRILTKQNNAKSKFPGYAKLGTSGSATEQGLIAAEKALSVPHAFDTCDSQCKSCKTDKDCPQNMFCVADSVGKKACGGWNRSFLRKKAGLEVVFVSDEDDQSPGALSYYVNFLKSIKGFANKGLMHAHAIVGTGGSCGAQKGARYMTVAKETGGKIASICDPSFAKTLKDIGNVAFGLSHQFFLTMNAQPGTVKVWVNGKACTGPDKSKTWYLDEASNSVILVDAANGGTCLPAKIDPNKGGKVKVYYKVLCYPGTP